MSLRACRSSSHCIKCLLCGLVVETRIKKLSFMAIPQYQMPALRLGSGDFGNLKSDSHIIKVSNACSAAW